MDDSTVSQPNLKTTIKAVALAIFFHIRNRVPMDAQRQQQMAALEPNILLIFDEKLHPLSVSLSLSLSCDNISSKFFI